MVAAAVIAALMIRTEGRAGAAASGNGGRRSLTCSPRPFLAGSEEIDAQERVLRHASDRMSVALRSV
ncbi:hypothetical protein DXT68_03620 [Microbacterium foliorum]|uniref:hypothetical protein n=1 Tax=Microbacterium foliorum TaxID=104336 RepID=UPI0005EC73BA|nr:hypothetical protein [Microbacterium foliorum]AXL11318.1 hypothetical protein DXT68_03620 [Microbacterium foliorum]CAH0159962.1 hypothetical protein SRABI03_00980 [Microbacterium foliorum]